MEKQVKEEEKFVVKRVHGKENTFVQVDKKEINRPTLNVSFADLLKNKLNK
jgi:hypothetical protein